MVINRSLNTLKRRPTRSPFATTGENIRFASSPGWPALSIYLMQQTDKPAVGLLLPAGTGSR